MSTRQNAPHRNNPRSQRIGPLSRRDFLRVSGCVLGAGIAYWALRPSPVAAGVLPPGAVPPADFHAACLRCGQCTAVCDQQAIQMDNTGSPSINGLSGWCDFCMCCVDICPAGVLENIDPQSAKLGTAVINQDRCIAWLHGGCLLCLYACNDLQQAVWIDADYHPYIDPEKCNGCGACVYACQQPIQSGGNKKHGKAVALYAF